MKRTPTHWFQIWRTIITREGEITRVLLSELSGASIWTIKALQKDFLDWDAFINYHEGKFKLSLLSLPTHREIEN